ncbi:MAG: ABC transporter permease [Clostridia bacterium]|nr:ABC transporter permease [Clostridia bacterium]
MKKSIGFLKKDIKRNFGRFAAALLVIALSVGFLTGLVSIAPDMKYTADKYYDENNFWDINIKSTLGFTADDIAAIRNEKYVENASGIITLDATASHNLEGNYPIRIYAVDFETEMASGKLLSAPVIVEGTYPINQTSCVVLRSFALKNDVKIGDKIYLNSGGDLLSEIAFTVTGIAESVEFASGDRQANTSGDSTIALAMYVSRSVYPQADVYTDVLVRVKDADKADTFSKAYNEKIDSAKQKLEKLAKEREKVREESITNQQQSELGEITSNYNDYQENTYSQLAAQKKYVNKLKSDIEKTEKDLLKKREALDATKASLDEQAEEIAALKAKGDAATSAEKSKISQYDSALKKYKKDDKELTKKENVLSVDKTIYEQAKKSYDKNVKEANKELANAKNEYNDYKDKEQQSGKQSWLITDRTQNAGFLGFKSNIDKITTIASVFPIIFFMIATCVVSVAVYQTVKEQSKEIGVLKSIGYTDKMVIKRNTSYAILVSTLGIAIGLVVGVLALPLWVYSTYNTMYTYGPLKVLVLPQVVIPVALVGFLCIVGSAYFISRKYLAKAPAGLVNANATRPTKTALQQKLEQTSAHLNGWLKNLFKVVMRDGKRFIVTALGIAGCTALLLTGFGLRDSVVKIDELQYQNIQKYDASISLKSGVDYSKADNLKKVLKNKEYVEGYSPILTEIVTYTDGNNETLSVIVPLEEKSFNKLVSLNKRLTKQTLNLQEKGVIVGKNTAASLGVKVGDKISLRTASGVIVKLKVGAISENYAGNFIYVSPAAYKKATKADAAANSLLVNLKDGVKANDFEQMLKNTGLTQSVTYTADTADYVVQKMSSIEYIVQFIILAAIVLNIVVVYVLIDINLANRKDRIGAMKNIGFTLRESVEQLYAEIALSSALGLIVGLLIGTLLHLTIVSTYNTADIILGRGISVVSFVLAVAIVTVVVAASAVAVFLKIKKKSK